MNDPTERVRCIRVLPTVTEAIENIHKLPIPVSELLKKVAENDDAKLLSWINNHLNFMNYNLITWLFKSRRYIANVGTVWRYR